MQTLDSRDSYGAIARWLHWTMFALIAVQIAGGIFLEDLPKGSALRGLAFDGHETAGIVAILLVLARVAWKPWVVTFCSTFGSSVSRSRSVAPASDVSM